MHANDISHRDAQRAEIARAVQAFEAAGGQVQKLEAELPPQPEPRTLRDLIEKHCRKQPAVEGVDE